MDAGWQLDTIRRPVFLGLLLPLLPRSVGRWGTRRKPDLPAWPCRLLQDGNEKENERESAPKRPGNWIASSIEHEPS